MGTEKRQFSWPGLGIPVMHLVWDAFFDKIVFCEMFHIYKQTKWDFKTENDQFMENVVIIDDIYNCLDFYVGMQAR